MVVPRAAVFHLCSKYATGCTDLKKILFLALHLFMRPDYPYKLFNDKRSNYILLVQTLAEESLPNQISFRH